MSEPSIALGTKVFSRTDKLERLLESATDKGIDRVYVADDGHTAERQHLYDREYPFDLVLIDLEYDAGVGYGRSRLVEEVTEDFLLILDSDHQIHTIEPLVAQLSAREDLGGVSGLMYNADKMLRVNCHDLYEEDGVLVRDIRGNKPFQTVAGHPLVEFDFMPTPGLFRTEALRDYAWDPKYVIGKDHLDFYVGHYRRTDWNFGICLNTTFSHHPGGGSGYFLNRRDTRKTWEGKRYFLEKWGYDQIVTRRHWWRNYSDESSAGGLVGSFANRLNVPSLPLPAQKRLMDLHDVGMRGKAVLFPYLYE